MDNKKIVSIEISTELYSKLKELSIADSRSFSSYVRRILEMHVNSIESSDSI